MWKAATIMAKDMKKLHDALRELLDIVNEHEVRLDALERDSVASVVPIDDRLKEWKETDFVDLKPMQLKIIMLLLSKQDSLNTKQMAVALSVPREEVTGAINGLSQKQNPNRVKKQMYEKIIENVHGDQYRFAPEMRTKYKKLIESVWTEYGDDSFGK